MKKIRYEDCFKGLIQRIDRKLRDVLPAAEQKPAVIHEAMSYAIFPGGKRFRAILTLAACEACGGKSEDALLAAVALEMIHGYSLVHDDLPALDDDDIRRGKPTVHKKYGEAIAILTGDGLLTLAFETLGQIRPPERALALLQEISTASGTYGMIGGQVADLTTAPEDRSLPMLDYINTHKTGKLIKASAVCGAIAAGASKRQQKAMLRYGELIGLAFQSVDDMIDRDGSTHFVKDREMRMKIRDLIAEAKRTVRPMGRQAETLLQLSDFLLARLPRGSHAQVD